MARATHISDTITAVATPPGEGALAIVRVSGPNARAIAEGCLRAAADPERFVALAPRVATYCLLVDARLEPIDEVVAVFYAGPRSFTGEDMLELICHGGHVVTGRVLAAMVASGARPAQPGEFTRRAFLEGRIDLAKAEAIGALIHAQSEAAARVALRQLRGGLSERIHAATGLLLDVLALTEAYIDFPEERLPEAQRSLRDEKLDAAEEALDELLKRTDTTLVSRAGARVVLAGAPNAGKSSLFNALVGRERALVADLPGTTRDTVEAAARLGDVRLTLVDTAGMREVREARATTATHGLLAPRRMMSDPTRPVTHADVEQMGIERAREEVVGADVMLWVFDGATEPTEDEEKALSGLQATCPVIRVATKCDRADFRARAGAISVSSRSGEGLEQLRSMIREHVTKTEVADPLVIEARHAESLELARAAVLRARVAFAKIDEAAAGAISHPEWVDDSGELAATDLREAVICLGEITGTRDHAALNEAVLDRIFSSFCIGK